MRSTTKLSQISSTLHSLDTQIAEMNYALRLDKISSDKYDKSFTLGTLADEIANFKQNCESKARQAAEVGENVLQDCVEPLKELLERQEQDFLEVDKKARKRIDKLYGID